MHSEESVCVCVCVMAELMALESKCLQWDPLVMKGGMQDREKSVRRQRSNSLMTQKYWQS